MEIKNEIKRVAFYIRVSTEEQARDGYGLDYQLDALKKLIDFKTSQIPQWITNEKIWYVDDGYSGGDLNRPKFKEMMQAAQKGEFDIIAVWKIDRMSRNLSHLLKVFEDLRGYGVSFFSLKENIDFSGPVGRLTFQIFGALAEFEREMIKSRTNEGKRASARRGNYIGNGIPYGYDVAPKKEGEKGSKLVIVEEEAEILRQIFRWFVFEGYHYAKIVNKLKDLGISKGIASRSKYKNTEWQQNTIKSMLQNGTYMGLKIERLKNDEGEIEEIEVSTPIIIDENTFEFAQLKILDLDSEKIRDHNGGGNNTYLLSRKIVDRDTQKCLVGYQRNKNTYGYRRKKVVDKQTGKIYENIDIPGEAIDTFVWSKIQTAIKRPEELFLLFQKQISVGNDVDVLREKFRILDKQIKTKRETIENIELEYYDGKLSEEKKDRFVLITQNQLIQNEKELHEIERKINNLIKIMYSEEVIKSISKKYEKNIDNLTIQQKQSIIAILVDKIYIQKENGGELKIQVIFKFDPQKIESKELRDELKKSSTELKASRTSDVSNVNGRGRETRTHNPALPKRVR